MIKKILSKLKAKSSKSDKVKVEKAPAKKAVKKVSGKKTGGKVVVYSTHTCPWCAKTKEFLKANKVSFTNKFVDTSKPAAQEMIKKSGQQSVPVIIIGSKVIVGFSESKLKSALGL